MIPLLVGLMGGCIYRVRGMAHPWKKYVRRPITQIIFSSMYAYFAYLSGGYIAGIATLIGTTLFILGGHGRYFFGTDWSKDSKPETLEFIIIWLIGILPEYWYKVLGMALSGLSISLLCGLCTLNPFIALSGVLKAPAYMIGQWMYDVSPKVKKKGSSGNTYNGIKYLPKHLDVQTEIGEFLTGLFLYLSLYLLARHLL